MRATLPAVVALLAFAGMAHSEDATLGAPAPALTLAKTVKGEPISAFKPGKVYVVEFWATWCGPCKVSIPHLTEMAKKYTDTTFLGVSVWESGRVVKSTDHAKIDSFVKTMGDKMAYNVAADTEEGDMAKNWMDAYHRNGIPSAFIVDKTGKVVYVDHPMAPKFEESLKEVIAGTFDVAKAKADMEAEAAKRAAYEKSMKELNTAMAAAKPDVLAKAKASDFDGAEKALKAVFEAHPIKDEEGNAMDIQVEPQLLNMLKGSDEAAYYGYVGKIVDGKKAEPMMLNSIAWDIATNKRFKKPDYALAIKAATQACEKTEWTEDAIIDTLAEAYFRSGNKAKAIDMEEKAIAVAKDPAQKKEYEASLKRFKG